MRGDVLSTTEIDKRTDDALEQNGERRGAIELLLALEESGAADEVSLVLTDPDLPYERWEDLGRFLGSIDRRARWYIGDWLNAGEELYGEESAQAIDDTTKTRYDEAERVTGLDHGTMMNIRSVCGKVLRDVRRRELGFWIHAEVAPLDPPEQVSWLQRAIDEGLTREQLRKAIKEDKNPPSEDDEPPADEGGSGEGLSIGEQIEAAARTVWNTGQPTSDGDILVPRESWSQLGAALGEE